MWICIAGRHEHDSPPGVSNGLLLDLLDLSWSEPKGGFLETRVGGEKLRRATIEAASSDLGGVH